MSQSSVEDMSGMFYRCQSLESANFEKVDLSKTKKLSSLFEGCTNLKNINLNLDTSNIESIDHLFTD